MSCTCTLACLVLQAVLPEEHYSAINNMYGCDTDELCSSFIIKMLLADGKCDRSVSKGFSRCQKLMASVFVYTAVETFFSINNRNMHLAKCPIGIMLIFINAAPQ